jgi:hypothetical protein
MELGGVGRVQPHTTMRKWSPQTLGIVTAVDCVVPLGKEDGIRHRRRPGALPGYPRCPPQRSTALTRSRQQRDRTIVVAVTRSGDRPPSGRFSSARPAYRPPLSPDRRLFSAPSSLSRCLGIVGVIQRDLRHSNGALPRRRSRGGFSSSSFHIGRLELFRRLRALQRVLGDGTGGGGGEGNDGDELGGGLYGRLLRWWVQRFNKRVWAT